ncbi:hypothetical protein E2C01_072974 [Portunus trituberculatus]|uniref:Magnesium transporter NIPA2 n=1 Tax=Portunus trituberculatus TaxID=210409 RepID=A0A5B7IAE6_PORTR|nr:hypothetical protein [Portunus trituberculatus]
MKDVELFGCIAILSLALGSVFQKLRSTEIAKPQAVTCLRAGSWLVARGSWLARSMASVILRAVSQTHFLCRV